MGGWLKNTKLSTKVFILSGVTIIGLLLITATYYYEVQLRNSNDESRVKSEKMKDAMSAISIAMLQARRNEKDFIMIKDLDYVAKHKESLDSIFASLSEIQGVLEKSEEAQIQKMKKAIDSYNVVFKEFVDVMTAVGLDEDNGAMGVMRKNVHEIEENLKATNSEALLVKMLMMRRHEKDYLVRLEDKYATNMADRLQEFNRILQRTDLDAGLKADINSEMSAYHNAFLEVVKQTHLSAVKLEEMRAAIHQVEPEIESLDHDVHVKYDLLKAEQEETSKTIDRLFYIVISLIFIVIFLMTVITLLSMNGLKKAAEKIEGSIQQVATAAAQSSNAIAMVADGAKRQIDSISQAVTAVMQSVSVLAEVSKSADGATDLAKESGRVVRSGKDKMDSMVRVVSRIQENSNKVNKITEIIGNIANQTNMLALNAAIEAARAGEQGKGFAVVADQVKSLAENSKSSVEDIVSLIEQAKIDAAEAVMVAKSVNDEMEKILNSSSTTERMMQSVSTAMEEQVSTTEELSQNMDTLRDIGTSNANASEEITETIIELSRIASDANDEVKKFNI